MAPVGLLTRASAVPHSLPASTKRFASIVTKPGSLAMHPTKPASSPAASSAKATSQCPPSSPSPTKTRVYANQLPAELRFVLFQSKPLALESLDSLLSRAQASPAVATGMENRFLEKQRSTGPTELCLSKAFRATANPNHSEESALPHSPANDSGLRDLERLVEQSQKTVQVLRHVLKRQQAENQALRHQLQGSVSNTAAAKTVGGPRMASSSRVGSDASSVMSSSLPTAPERCLYQQPSLGPSPTMAAASPVDGGSFASPMPSQPCRKGHTLSLSSKSVQYTLKPMDTHPLARHPRRSQDPSLPQPLSSTPLTWWQWCQVGGLTTLTGWAVMETEALADLATISSSLVSL
ncbi:hypothetical protein H4R34_003289 [Dimargaris verticillata]|uniref:Uncharacterized protein n=1 Tax=Dimargaris verticillata TaxID=2761393 RepID=A0A9W8B4U9_9FUNG|nr:hypothetical protein H4R34_003289 [Dimargaris verticillata]